MYFFNNYSRLGSVYKKSDEINIYPSSKLVFFSDCHRGDNSPADDFAPNSSLYISALDYYYTQGFTYIEIGDGDELWENRRFSSILKVHGNAFQAIKQFHKQDRFYMVLGNHDMVKRYKMFLQNNMYKIYNPKTKCFEPFLDDIKINEGLILRYYGTPYTIFVVHGHQCDFLNDRLWPLSRFLVRYIFRPLEIMGLSNFISPAQNVRMLNSVERNLINWVKANNQIVIAGHTHRPVYPSPGEPPYFNDGCCVKKGFITGIEISNGEIALVKWSMKHGKGNIPQASRDIVAGPQKLEFYFPKK